MPTPSVEPIVRSRLLPRISFRAGMLAVTASVLIAWMARLASQGHILPRVICFTLLSLVAFYVASAVLFLIAWIPAILMRRYQDQTRSGNPFAADQLPPQVLPPKSMPQ